MRSTWRIPWSRLALCAAVFGLARCASGTHTAYIDALTPATVAPATSGIDARSTGEDPMLAPAGVSAPSIPVAEPGRADLDPSNDDVVAPPAPIADCEERLSAAGIQFARAELPLRSGAKGTIICGAEQVVEYRGSASGIRYNASPLVTCGLALALARFESLLQDEAELHFQARVKRLEQAGTYNCRKMARFRDMVSEHSYANAIDIRGVTLSDGRTIDVLHHFGKLDAQSSSERGLFLREVAHRAFDEQVFSVVLTPFYDSLHRDHFHLDMARYRADGTR